ncbi:lytic transglycosylase domain-containing protein [Rhizobacter sp. OV335]|uniref:lytic transglycosylase domain-containing protein n=1 Tax=Rhizobacter sp. OV335 TaxID=1500264 RepID=UPI00091197CE|nr:lytic transglycosylase domain-containing protein [Rhizobacter sp. OV335]SHM00330.1 Soluble lytic murein transglycosylase [Rhizobacter sp. OV335]
MTAEWPAAAPRVEGAVRRRWLLAAAAAPWLALPMREARAGAQVEEPLADAVRGALAAAIANSAPPKPVFVSTDARLAYLRWLGEMSTRLKKRKAEHVTRIEFLDTLWYESTRAGLEPALMLGLVQVESGFRKYAISSVGARGYMQVMPFWARVIGNGDVSRLFHMQTNLRFGCVIMRHYLDVERGDLYMALGRYNGSRGKPEYPNLVFGAKKYWDYKPG